MKTSPARKAAGKKWALAHPERYKKIYTISNFLWMYGDFLSKEQIIKLLEERKTASCAICKNKSHRQLHIDHSHDKKKFRGLLCHKCNFLIGLANDNIEILQAAIEYLKK